MASAMALKYARALADVAFEMAREQETLGELFAFRDLLASHDELGDALENPAIPFSAKRKIVERLAAAMPLSKIALNFVLIILAHARIRQFDDFAEAYQLVLDERRGLVRGKVLSASPLAAPLQERLHQAVARNLGKQTKLTFETDESLIGGLRLQVGSMIFDGSIRTRLEVLHKKLASQ